MNVAELDDRPLPTGWIRRQSKSRKDKYYYFNTVTRKSSWKNPLDSLDLGDHDKLSANVSFRCVLTINVTFILLLQGMIQVHKATLPLLRLSLYVKFKEKSRLILNLLT